MEWGEGCGVNLGDSRYGGPLYEHWYHTSMIYGPVVYHLLTSPEIP